MSDADGSMNLQQQWDALCRTFEARDWEELDLLLPRVQERLDVGESPVISAALSSAFNLALATAGVAFIRSHFTRTDEWPTVDDQSSAAKSVDQ